jgi:hypothetical protein
MKKILVLITIVALATVAHATPVISGYESVSETEFSTLFNSVDNLGYITFRAGSTGSAISEIISGSNSSGIDESEDTSWNVDGVANPVSVGITTGSTLVGSHLSSSASHIISDPVNQVWLALSIDTDLVSGSSISLVNQTFDGVLLPDIIIGSTPGFASVKFYDSNRTTNLGDHTYLADLIVDREGSFTALTIDDFKFTYVVTQNAAIPELPL